MLTPQKKGFTVSVSGTILKPYTFVASTASAHCESEVEQKNKKLKHPRLQALKNKIKMRFEGSEEINANIEADAKIISETESKGSVKVDLKGAVKVDQKINTESCLKINNEINFVPSSKNNSFQVRVLLDELSDRSSWHLFLIVGLRYSIPKSQIKNQSRIHTIYTLACATM